MEEDGSWQSPSYRQSVVNKIAEAISSEISGLTPSNAVEMENHAYSKAKNEDEYVALIRRLIVHINFHATEDGGNHFQVEAQQGNYHERDWQLQWTNVTTSSVEINLWRSPSFRQSVVNIINQTIGSPDLTPMKKTVNMENQIFSKARDKNEYFKLVARLITYIREMNNKNSNSDCGNSSQNGVQQSQGQQQKNQDHKMPLDMQHHQNAQSFSNNIQNEDEEEYLRKLFEESSI